MDNDGHRSYQSILDLQLTRLMKIVLDLCNGPAVDMAQIVHCFGTGVVSEQLMVLPRFSSRYNA